MAIREQSEEDLLLAEVAGKITGQERRAVLRHWNCNDQLKTNPRMKAAPNYLVQEATAHDIMHRAFSA